MEVEATVLEEVSYRELRGLGPGEGDSPSLGSPPYTFLAHHPYTAPSAVRGGDGQQSGTTGKVGKQTFIFEILGERDQAEDEWMYQIQKGEETTSNEAKCLAAQLRAVTAMSGGQWGSGHITGIGCRVPGGRIVKQPARDDQED
jgi:hypothetical protein